MKYLQVDNRSIGASYPVFIIAEAGVNHNGDPNLAKELAYNAKACGADCVKFQTFKAERLVTREAPKAQYQLHTTDPNESQMQMLRNLELPEESYEELFSFCRKEGIIFLSTPYNVEDVDFLDSLGVPAFKIASGQAVEPYFLDHVAKKGKPILLSTGMCTLAEIDEAVRVIRRAGNSQLVVLQCTTNYPSSIEDCNLRAMVTMANALNVLVGYSDHTIGLTAPTVAATLGACVIEKHLTLDKTLPGPDHSSSSDPDEFSELVKVIRETESALGASIKMPTEREKTNIIGMRRSLVSQCDIQPGEKLSFKNLTLKRPGNGIPARNIHFVLGKTAAKMIPANTLITLDMFK